mgnify:CR=1 FL=1
MTKPSNSGFHYELGVVSPSCKRSQSILITILFNFCHNKSIQLQYIIWMVIFDIIWKQMECLFLCSTMLVLLMALLFPVYWWCSLLIYMYISIYTLREFRGVLARQVKCIQLLGIALLYFTRFFVLWNQLLEKFKKKYQNISYFTWWYQANTIPSHYKIW